MKIKVFRDKYEDALERKVNEFLSSPQPFDDKPFDFDEVITLHYPQNIQIQPALSGGEMLVVVTYE